MYSAISASASLRGSQNRAEGELFEQLIEKSCEYYRTKDIAFIEKTPEPFRVTRSLGNGRFEGHFAKQAQPDFKGVIKQYGCYGGKAIVFDAKATRTDRIPTSALTAEQIKELEIYSECGAFTGVLMCFGFKRFIHLAYYKFKAAKELVGHQYWTADEAAQFGREMRFESGIIKLFEE